MPKSQPWHDLIMTCNKCDYGFSAYWSESTSIKEAPYACRECGNLLEGVKIYGTQAN